MIHFDFDNRYQDELVVGRAISTREGIIWSVVVHIILIGLLIAVGRFLVGLREIVSVPVEMQARQEPDQTPRFVFMQPLVEKPPAPPRERPELSDQDRRAATSERPEAPKNPLPFSRGNTSERVEAAQPQPPQEQAAAPPQESEPTPPPQRTPDREAQITRNDSQQPPVSRRPTPERPRVPGVLGEAVRNLSRYTENRTFDNPQGGNTDTSSTIQFDSKGVDFGPWLRRFVRQVESNWFVPLAAMNFHGNVVLQFYVHRNGSITDIRVVRPSDISSFNTAAFNAIVGSNPTEPLPPEYPDSSVLFTVTFFYNEHPPG